MRRSLMLKMSLVGALLTVGAFAEDRTTKDMNKGKADAAFVEEAAVISQAEIRLSQLAVNQSTNPAIKDLAQQMVDDHTKANDALKELAQKKGLMLPFDPWMGSTAPSGMGAGATGSGSTGSTGVTGTGSIGTSGSGSTGSDTTGSMGAPGSTGTTGMGSDPAAGSSPRGSDTTGATGSTGAGSTGSDIARAGSTGGTGSDTTGTAGSGSTSTDTYGAGSTGSDDKTATGAVGSTGSANYATKLSSAQKAFQKKYDELAKLSGEKFEKAYLGALLDDHKKAIRAFEKESKSGQDPELKTWASNTLPTLRHHLEMVQSVEKDLKNRGKSSM